jgi:FkbM family methyltransferase
MRPLPPLDTASPFATHWPGVVPRVAWALATAGSLSPALRRAARKRLAARLSGPFDVTVEGLRYRTYPAENRCDRVMIGRGMLPEAEEHRLFRPFLREGMVFVDIGANVGTYALWAAPLVGATGAVLALEPHPRTFAKLAYNRAANEADNVRCLNVAAGPASGSLDLWFDGGGNVGGASLLPGPSRHDDGGLPVAVEPLAAILAAQSVVRPDVIKVDVEGYEDRALLPYFGDTSRERWPGAVMIETALRDRWERDCLAELSSRGYEQAAGTAENVILKLAR